jgi:hypothetical protein
MAEQPLTPKILRPKMTVKLMQMFLYLQTISISAHIVMCSHMLWRQTKAKCPIRHFYIVLQFEFKLPEQLTMSRVDHVTAIGDDEPTQRGDVKTMAARHRGFVWLARIMAPLLRWSRDDSTGSCLIRVTVILSRVFNESFKTACPIVRALSVCGLAVGSGDFFCSHAHAATPRARA